MSHSVTVVVPHKDTPDWLEVSVALWLKQSIRPRILIVDTGSKTIDSEASLDGLARLDGVEIARLGIGPTPHPSDPIAIAMDFAFSRCETPFLLSTHVDVFPKRRDLIRYLLTLCPSRSAVVGWEMSPRGPGPSGDYTGRVSNGFPGHCCSLFHIATMDRIGAGWSLRRSAHRFGTRRDRDPKIKGWPDTETCLGNIFREHGVKPYFLGRETNNENQDTRYWIHARSRTNEGETPRHAKALSEARARLRRWGVSSKHHRRPSHLFLQERVHNCPYRFKLPGGFGCGVIRSQFRMNHSDCFSVSEETCTRCQQTPLGDSVDELNAVLWHQILVVSNRLRDLSPADSHIKSCDLRGLRRKAAEKLLVIKACRLSNTNSLASY